MPITFEDLGSITYARAFERQLAAHDRVLRWRADAEARPGAPAHEHTPLGIVFLLEHNPPVVTISRRASASANLLASPAMLEHHAIEVAETDRGGDITYHGPGQLVAYPILDLRRLALNLHAYIRLLEQAAIDTCAVFGLPTTRDPAATGVWVPDRSTIRSPHSPGGTSASPVPSPHAPSLPSATPSAGTAIQPISSSPHPPPPSSTHPAGAKIGAIGVRVRRWVSMHGLALNIATNLEHFALIVPCGLAGRPVTSLAAELTPRHAPDMPTAKAALRHALEANIARVIAQATRQQPPTTHHPPHA